MSRPPCYGIGDRSIYPVVFEDKPGQTVFHGMTYRQWLAGITLAGLAAYPEVEMTADKAAQTAIFWADALIAELEKGA